MPSETDLEDVVASAASGDEQAWQDLWTLLAPRLAGTLRRARLYGPTWRREDEIRDTLVAVMARLREDRFRRLNVYLEARCADPELGFLRWVRVLARRVAIDRLRATLGGRRPRWTEPVELLPDKLPCGRGPVTNRIAAGQILRYAIRALSEPQRRALEMWAGHGDRVDIALSLGLGDPGDVDRLVRAAVGRLRRHFRDYHPSL